MSSTQSLEPDQASKNSENDIEKLLESAGYTLKHSRSIHELSAVRSEDYSRIYIRDLEETFNNPDQRYEIGRYKNRFMPLESFRVDDLEEAYQLLIEDILDYEIEKDLQGTHSL